MARLKKFQKLRRSLPIPEVITLGFILYLVVCLKFSKSSLLVLFALGAASVVYLLWWFLDLCFTVPDQMRKLRQFFVEAWTLTRWDFAYRKIQRNWRRSEKQEQREQQEQKHSILPFLLLLFGCVSFFSLIPHVSYAFDPSHVTFYTYGSFDIVDNAFRKMSLIFSDSDYKGLFFTIMTMAIFFAGFINYRNAIAQKVQGGLVSWALPVLTGFIIYVAFVVPKGQVTIYDNVLNKTDTVGDIPLGITTLAGLSSEVQDGIIQVIDTSSVPGVSYRASGGGVGIETVFNIAHNGIESDSVYFDRSMEQYIKDCVLFDLSIGNTSWEDFKRGNKSFIDLFGQAVNPSVYTVWYDDANPTGATMSCTAAWNNHLHPYMNDNMHFQNALKNICQSSGLNVSSPTALNNCVTMIEGYLTKLYDGTSSITGAYGFIKQAYAANMVDRMVRNANVESVTNYYITTGGTSTGITMNAWMPVMRGVLIALGLGLLPFIILFIPTPLGGKVLGVIAALFIFIMSWGIADAAMHSAAISDAVTLFESVRQRHIGYDAFMIMSDPLSKALGMWGYFRMFGLTIAGIAAAAITKGGAYGIQVLARGAVAPVASKAGGIGAGVANPVERGKIAEELRNSMAAKRVVGRIPVQQYVEAAAASKAQALGRGEGFTKAYQKAQSKGFTGNEVSFQGYMSNVQLQREYTNTSAVKEAAAKYFAGDTMGMLQTEADFHEHALASDMAEMRKKGWDHKLVASVKGHFNAVDRIASLSAKEGLGDEGEILKESMKVYNEGSKATMRKAIEEIQDTGQISKDTNDILNRIAQSPVGRAQLMTQGIGDMTVAGEKEGKNLANWIYSKTGKQIDPKDLAGHTVQFHVFKADGNGLGVSVMDSKTGTKVTDLNTSTVHLNGKNTPSWAPAPFSIGKVNPTGGTMTRTGTSVNFKDIILDPENAKKLSQFLSRISPKAAAGLMELSEQGKSVVVTGTGGVRTGITKINNVTGAVTEQQDSSSDIKKASVDHRDTKAYGSEYVSNKAVDTQDKVKTGTTYDLGGGMSTAIRKGNVSEIYSYLLKNNEGFLASNTRDTWRALAGDFNERIERVYGANWSGKAEEVLGRDKRAIDQTSLTAHADLGMGAGGTGAGGSASYTHTKQDVHSQKKEHGASITTTHNVMGTKLTEAENRIFERTKNIKDPAERAKIRAAELSAMVGNLHSETVHAERIGGTSPVSPPEEPPVLRNR